MGSEMEHLREGSSPDEEENFRERFCSGTVEPIIISEDGFDRLKDMGLVDSGCPIVSIDRLHGKHDA